MLQNLMGFSGRIGRQSWWIGFILLLIVYFVVSIAVSSMLGASFLSMITDPSKLQDPAVVESLVMKSAWLGLSLLVVFFYPYAALTAKRLNDRNRPSWLNWGLWFPVLGGAVLNVLGMGYTISKHEKLPMYVAMPTPISYVFSVFSFIALVWWVVDCGFLRGTEGPNRYGPDPIAD